MIKLKDIKEEVLSELEERLLLQELNVGVAYGLVEEITSNASMLQTRQLLELALVNYELLETRPDRIPDRITPLELIRANLNQVLYYYLIELIDERTGELIK